MRRFLSVLTVAAMVLSLTACGTASEKASKNNDAGNTPAVTETAEKAQDSGSETAVPEDSIYPMEGVSLTYWMELNNNISQKVSNQAETPFYKALNKATGVEVTYQHPAAGQTAEQFNLMVTSGEMPDIIEYDILKRYPGGPEKAIADGVIVDLTDLLPKYAPNLMKYYEEHPEVAKLARTDDGKYYCFPFIRGDALLTTYVGPIVNGKWLQDLGLSYPETMDDWYTMLTRFKNEKGVAAPLTYEAGFISDNNGTPFLGAYGVAEDFYLDGNGDIQYGSIQPGYKEFLETFSKWYAEGLIDMDIQTLNREQVAAKMTTGESGASLGLLASRLGEWLKATDGNADYNFVGVKSPVLQKGDIPMFTQKEAPLAGSPGDAYITTSCKNVEEAIRFLDYGYSEEGYKLFNFGTEGESYNMVDGYPTYTDTILNNPDMPRSEALTLNARSSYNGPFVQAKEYMEQYGFAYPQQKEALANWTITNVDKYKLPALTPTSEESTELAVIINNITTYRDEMQAKYIMGIESLDSYDTYVKNIKGMGLDRAIEIYKAAFERFNKR